MFGNVQFIAEELFNNIAETLVTLAVVLLLPNWGCVDNYYPLNCLFWLLSPPSFAWQLDTLHVPLELLHLTGFRAEGYIDVFKFHGS